MASDSPSVPSESRWVTTVLGPISADEIGRCDAHTHVWIDPVEGSLPGSPVLNEYPAILAELQEYRQLGGSAIVDCQPGGCGRNGLILARLARESGVHILAATGFHRTRYYPHNYWLWKATANEACAYFLGEIQVSLTETRALEMPVKACFIKVACEATLKETPRHSLEGAVAAAVQSGAAIEVHTERGADVEAILRCFLDSGVPANKLVLCHMDKRPDIDLHQELASSGVLLEYDTFFRPKYNPDEHVWPLIEAMIDAGYERRLALATDIAELGMWQHQGGPGLFGFLTIICQRLKAIGLSDAQLDLLLGKNIIRQLI